MATIRRLAMWLVMRGPRLPFDWAPRLMSFELGSKGVKMARDVEGMVVVEGRTYHCREGLKRIGGVWDPEDKVWRVPKEQRLMAELLVNNGPSGPEEDIADSGLPWRQRGH